MKANYQYPQTEQNRNLITLKLLQFLVTIYNRHKRIHSAVGRGDCHITNYVLLRVSSSLSGSTFVIVQYKLAWLVILFLFSLSTKSAIYHNYGS